MLSTDSDSPPVTKTAVGTNFLQTFNIVTKLSIDVLCEDLHVFPGLEILLSVKEPKRDLKLSGVLDNCYKLFDFIGGKFSRSLVDIDLSLFADKVGESATKTLNFGHSENNISLTLNVSVENTKNVLELSSLDQ